MYIKQLPPPPALAADIVKLDSKLHCQLRLTLLPCDNS